MTGRPAKWWELSESDQLQGRQGAIAMVKGTTTEITCPECGNAPVVYNGNYFCDDYPPIDQPGPSQEGQCDWALAHPATTKRDQQICDLIGTDYG